MPTVPLRSHSPHYDLQRNTAYSFDMQRTNASSDASLPYSPLSGASTSHVIIDTIGFRPCGLCWRWGISWAQFCLCTPRHRQWI